MHDGRGKNHQACLWQYSRPRGSVVFDFRLGREREGPRRFLGNFEGLLQSDGYGGYDHIGGKGIVHAACWAHARRKFFDAVKLNPKDQTSIRIVVGVSNQRFSPPELPTPPWQPKNRRYPSAEEEKRLRALDPEVSRYLDFGVSPTKVRKVPQKSP